MNVLMLGGPNAGKSTFLVQLYGRIRARSGRLVSRATPDDLRPIRDGLERLATGLSLEHTTPSSDQVIQSLPAATREGVAVDVEIPEYAGETLDDLVRSHRIPETWRPLIAESEQWLLFVRLEQFANLPELLTKPIGELATSSEPCSKDAARANGPDGQQAVDIQLPLDMRLVELLQMALHERGETPRLSVVEPHLTVLLSCWDELNLAAGVVPADVAAERIPLLHSYLRAVWAPDSVEYFGLSAQGQPLPHDVPDESYLDKAPQDHGYIVMSDGSHGPDLTNVIRVR